MLIYAVAFLCVLGLAMGQILFKVSALSLSAPPAMINPKAALAFFAAILIYGVTSLVWVWVLQKVELGRIYPLMALAFVLVPLGSYIFLEERFQPQYFLGVMVIVVGIVITMRS